MVNQKLRERRGGEARGDGERDGGEARGDGSSGRSRSRRRRTSWRELPACLAPVELNLSHKPLRLPPIDGDAPREVKEPRTKGLEKRKRAVPKAFEMPAPPELLS